MPAQEQKSGLLASMGGKAVEAFKNNMSRPPELNIGGGLPPGIDNGVARFTGAKLGVFKDGDNKGKPFFMATGSVVSPKEVTLKDGSRVPVFGQTTKIGPEPLCDTPKGKGKRKTASDHFNFMLDHLRSLGLDEYLAKSLPGCQTDAQLEAVLNAGFAALKKQGPYFRFRTFKGDPTPAFPNPRTTELWGEVLPDFDPNLEGAGDNDQTGQPAHEASVNGVAPTGSADDFQAAEEEEAAAGTEEDLDALALAADPGGSDDSEAQDRLEKLAIDAGYTAEEVSEAESWNAVDEMIRSPRGSDDTPPEPEPAKPAEPKVGDAVGYKPIDPKTKKPVKKAIQCEILAVDKKAKTVKLKNLSNPKAVYTAKWDALD